MGFPVLDLVLPKKGQPRHSGVWRRTIPELIKSAGQLASTTIEHYCPVPLQCANGLEHM